MAEVTLRRSAPELTAFSQLIDLAARGFEMKDAYDRRNEIRLGSRHNTQHRPVGQKEKEKNCAVTFPNILFGS